MGRSKIAYRLRGRPDSITFESGSAAVMARRAKDLMAFGMFLVPESRRIIVTNYPNTLKPGEILLTLSKET